MTFFNTVPIARIGFSPLLCINKSTNAGGHKRQNNDSNNKRPRMVRMYQLRANVDGEDGGDG